MTEPYPARGEEGCAAGGQSCVSDAEIQSEILAPIKGNESKGWSTDTAQEPTARYLFYTPPVVSDCYKEAGDSASECSNVTLCGYHAEIEEKSGPEKRVAIYSDLPYAPNVTPARRLQPITIAEAAGSARDLIHQAPRVFAAGRKGPRQRLGDQAAASGVAGRVVVDAV